MKVDLLIVGAGRSGTTSLCKTLEEHPDVCFSNIKEVHYFSLDELFQRGEKYYHEFFKHYNNQKIIASADTYLFINHEAIKRIKAYNPDIKIVILLRNPVNRAFSSYNYSINYGHHLAYNSFLDSIEHEKNIEKTDIINRNNLGHFYASRYHYHISKWLECFPKEQLLILETNNLKTNSKQFYFDFFSSLKIEPNFEIETKKLNKNAIPKWKGFEQFLLNRDHFIRKILRNTIPRKIKNVVLKSGFVDKMHDINRIEKDYSTINKEEYQIAIEYFKSDLELLQKDFGISFIY